MWNKVTIFLQGGKYATKYEQYDVVYTCKILCDRFISF